MEQAQAKNQRKRKQEVLRLVSKIRRLKNKLITYGMTGKQSIDAILYQFLKAPQIDWSLPHNTAIFYQIQNKYHTDHNTAQLILILDSIVPNWETRSVVQYLHQTLTYNALSFGIDLQISDDSSNQDGNDMTLLLIKAKKKNQQFGLKAKKRSHLGSIFSNRLYQFARKQHEHGDQQAKKKVHSNEKVEELKPQRKQTFQNFDEYLQTPQHNCNEEVNQDYFNGVNDNQNEVNQNQLNLTNKQSALEEIKMKRAVLECLQQSVKRYQPTQFETVEEEKLQKKVKK